MEMLIIPEADLHCGGDGFAGSLKLDAGEVEIRNKRWRSVVFVMILSKERTTSSPEGVVQSHRAVGGTIICLRKVEASTIYSLNDRHGVTHMSGAPVVLNILTKSPDVEPLKNPVHIITAGASTPAAVILRTESLGFVVSHGYGLTETTGLVVSCAWKQKWSTFPASERARLKARQGVTMAGFTEMDVVDPSIGESVKRDGVLVGEKYVEVESVLYTHPAIHEEAVVGRADEFWGETPCAFVD
ncbi:hypothetical protein SADUNF_Sadunf13G0076800 [Salix dunnii]|uniref:AMP-dependent synthetase/ligase domain-containing protein n=1 Tax=Salix dunnii TaxID=1413687 RepID=A0A835JHT0_9ROSI|nr:hypothetical protein SADUNF_Sadunf13G0076800 [Salix dunnii]